MLLEGAAQSSRLFLYGLLDDQDRASGDSEQVLVVLECEEQLSEEPRERLALVWREGRDQPFLVLNVCGCDRVYARKPGTGERDERAAPVGGVGIAADEPASFESVETFCRAAA